MKIMCTLNFCRNVILTATLIYSENVEISILLYIANHTLAFVASSPFAANGDRKQAIHQ